MGCERINNKIEERFQESIIEDSKYIEPWMISWDYQEERVKNIRYPKDYPAKFDTFDGISDIEKWINWISKSEFKDDIPDRIIDGYSNLSYKYDKEILNIKDKEKYLSTIGRYNAEDYIYQNRYNWNNKILDFGPGYGRQINLLSQLTNELVYVGIEGILQPYCMQNLYYSNSRYPLYEYMDDKNIEISESGIYHLPTWRCDKLPNNYFDEIMCIQVLQEINKDLLIHILHVFSNILKRNGILYIRDHGKEWKYSSHDIDIEEILPSYGFELTYKSDLKDMIEIHGITRVWRKI